MLAPNLAVRNEAPIIIIALEAGGRALMTRDMELIRKIFAQIRGRTSLDYEAIDLPDVDPVILARHIEILDNAGLVEVIKSNGPGGLQSPHPVFAVKDLTWAGHDYVAILENDTVWNKIKEKLSPKELATLPFSTLKTLGLGLLDQYLKSKFGLP
jgi:hypothetical protein